MHNDLLLAALYYSEQLRWSVIPLSPGTKIPPKGFEVVQYRERIATRKEIESWWTKNPNYNVGIITGELSRILVIDHDKYKPEYSEEAALKLIPDNIVTPTTETPSGGQHQAFSFPDKKISIGEALIPAMDFRGEGGYFVAPPSINDLGKAYRWLKGLAPDEVELSTVPDALLKKLYLYIYRGSKEKERPETNSLQFLTQGRRDADLFSTANCLIKGGCKEDVARQVLNILAKSCNPSFPEKEAQNKIDSVLSRCERKERNLTEDLRRWIDLTSAYFSLTEAYDPLQILTSQKNTVHQIMHRLVKEGYVERHPNKNGIYRRIDREIEFMDFANADVENYVDLNLPVALHSKTKIFPKGVVVIAGVSGMGKTLFAFNAIAENFGKFPIYYFNSEMGPEMLKMKLSYFPIPMTDWNKNMKVIDQWDFNNIPDKIQPDAFNVVDYLEPEGEKAFNIHGVISSIIRRLNKGTALIAIQKKPGAQMGTGGIYSIKAATLAIALDWGKIEIVKNRFREADQMPSLTKINFEVHQGYKFVKVGGWYK